MPDLLHEYWYEDEQAMGAFGPVREREDRRRAASEPKARLVFSLWAASFNQALQGRNERLGYGEYVPVEGVPDHFYSEAERAEQDAYLRVRPRRMPVTVGERIEALVTRITGLTEAQIAEHLFGAGGYQQRVNSVCRRLVKEDRLKRLGKGYQSDPYTYYVAK